MSDPQLWNFWLHWISPIAGIIGGGVLSIIDPPISRAGRVFAFVILVISAFSLGRAGR